MNGTKSLRRTPIFVGEHDLIIDDKNRLLIPAQFRKKIVPEVHGSSLFVTLKKMSPEYGFIPWFYLEWGSSANWSISTPSGSHSG